MNRAMYLMGFITSAIFLISALLGCQPVSSKGVSDKAVITQEKLPKEETAEYWLELLSSPDKKDRETAAYRLCGYRESRVFQALLKQVKDRNEDTDVRWRALWSLSQKDEPELLPYYLSLLDVQEDRLWNQAVAALRAYGASGKAALPKLIDGLQKRDRRGYAAETLGAIGDPTAVPSLIASMKTDRNTSAAKALGLIKDPAAVPALIEAVKSGDSYLPGVAAWALSEIGAKEAVPDIIKAINNDHESMKHQVFRCAVAVKKLSGSLPPYVWGLLKRHLESGYFKYADGYIRILAESGDADFVPLIIECLSREHLRSDAVEALNKLTGENLGSDYVGWRLWLLRREHGGKLPPLPPDWQELSKGLLSDDTQTVLDSIRGLSKAGDVRAVSLLEDLYESLPDRPLDVRAETLRALTFLGKRDGLTRLMNLVKDRALAEQKHTVLSCMEGIRDDRIVDFLAEMNREAPREVKSAMLRIAKDAFRMEELFAITGRNEHSVIAMAEEALFSPEETSPWREGAEALSSILNIELLPQDIKEPKNSRNQAQRRWAAFVVGQAVRTMLELKIENQKAVEDDYRAYGPERTPAAQAFAWLDDRGHLYMSELAPLLMDERPLGQQCYWIYRGNMSPEPIKVPTVAAVAMEALRNMQRLPVNKKVQDYYLERFEQKDEEGMHHAAKILAWFDDPTTLTPLLVAWQKTNDKKYRFFLEQVISTRNANSLLQAFKAMFASADHSAKKQAIQLLKECVLPALWEQKKSSYLMQFDTPVYSTTMERRFNDQVANKLRSELNTEIRPWLIPVIAEAFNMDRDEQLWAVRIAAELEVSSLIPHIIEMLKHEDQNGVVRSAIESLEKLNAKEAIPHLELLLTSDTVSLRAGSAHALSELGARQSIPKLRKLLKDEHYWPGAEAARGMGLMGNHDSASDIVALLDRKPVNHVNWEKVIQAVSDLNARGAIPKLIEIVESREMKGTGVFGYAIKALGKLHAVEAMPILKQLAEQDSYFFEAARAIGAIGGPEARRFCRSVIESGDSRKLVAAAEGLAIAGDRLGYDLLVELLGSGYEGKDARDALVRLTGENFGPHVEEPGKDYQKECRKSLLAWHSWWRKNREKYGREYDE